MNRTAICIKLLLKLYSVEKINRHDLALYLECNERNIREYINELRVAGYNINSSRGFDGGYSLDKNEFFPGLKLTDSEIKDLEAGLNYISNRQDFINKDEFGNAIAKILANSRNNSSSFDMIRVVEKYPLNISKEELKNKYELIDKGIKNHRKIKVLYKGNTGNEKEYVLHPYECFIYNNNWYVLAWNESLRNIDPIGRYKLNRFIDIEVLNEGFKRIKTFDETKYIDNLSIEPAKKILVKILFIGVNTAIKERIYGDKQILTEISSESIMLECQMTEFDAIALVLSYGSNAIALQPVSLVEKVKESLKSALKRYE